MRTSASESERLSLRPRLRLRLLEWERLPDLLPRGASGLRLPLRLSDREGRLRWLRRPEEGEDWRRGLRDREDAGLRWRRSRLLLLPLCCGGVGVVVHTWLSLSSRWPADIILPLVMLAEALLMWVACRGVRGAARGRGRQAEARKETQRGKERKKTATTKKEGYKESKVRRLVMMFISEPKKTSKRRKNQLSV